MAKESDRLIVQGLRKGDEAAWRQLLDRYYGRLFFYVRRKLSGDPSAEDIVQEVFLGFLKSLATYDESRDLLSYLYTIASNKITDELRKRGRQPVQIEADLSTSSSNPLDRPDSQPRASTIARSNERRDLEEKALVAVLSDLIKEWKSKGQFERLKVMELLFLKNMPNKKVAERLPISEQQVANIRFAALRKIADRLQRASASR